MGMSRKEEAEDQTKGSLAGIGRGHQEEHERDSLVEAVVWVGSCRLVWIGLLLIVLVYAGPCYTTSCWSDDCMHGSLPRSRMLHQEYFIPTFTLSNAHLLKSQQTARGFSHFSSSLSCPSISSSLFLPSSSLMLELVLMLTEQTRTG